MAVAVAVAVAKTVPVTVPVAVLVVTPFTKLKWSPVRVKHTFL